MNAPSSMQDFPASAMGLLMQMIAMMGRRGATRLYRVPRSAAVGATTTTAGTPVRFRKSGFVIGMYGTTLGATAAEAANLEVAVQMTANEHLVTDGDSFAFASYRALFGDAQNWFPLDRYVKEGQDWFATFNNLSGAGITPSLYFAQVEDQQAH